MFLDDLPTAARAVANGLVTSRALVEAALRRYDETEPSLHAFAWLDAERALRLADAADAALRDHVSAGARDARLGLLHGVPLGVKDIIDIAGIPAERGCAAFAGRVAERDAALVANLQRAGAILLGKTVTAELAYFHPGPTTNPYDATRTPGGSSMGSAAAVGAGVVPAAVGTQTNGSIIRPAAYCGVVGVKATHGRVPVEGVFPFAPTLDHPGPLARTVEGCAWLLAAMTGEPLESWWAPHEALVRGGRSRDAVPRFAALRTSEWDSAEEAMQARFQADVDRIATLGGPVEWPDPPEGLDDGPAILQTIMAYESVRTVAAAIAGSEAKVSAVALELFARGAKITDREYAAALAQRERLMVGFARWIEPYDAVLTPPAVGEAPARESTGSPRFCSRWTLLGVPAVTIPTGRGPHGLPLGLQLVGARGHDRRVLAAAAWVEARIGWRAEGPH